MTRFFRLSGAGNDFLALVEPQAVPPAATRAAWCRRGVSAGADGLFVLRRGREHAPGDPPALTMDHFNPDGRPAALCINGTRCAARLALHLGWASEAMTVVTGAGPVAARAAGDDRIALELPRPGEPEPLELELELELSRELDGELGGELAGELGLPSNGDPRRERWAGFRVTVGVPHYVLRWPGPLGAAPVATLGPPLRRHPAFGEAGTNVDFVRFPAPDRIEVRSFERGVEAETLACGTGVLAAAAVGRHLGATRFPAGAMTTGGFELTVDRAAAAGGAAERWSLAGDARIVTEGRLLPGADRTPEPPRWAPA